MCNKPIVTVSIGYLSEQRGDDMAINSAGTPITSWQELRKDVDANGGVKTYTMEVLRDISQYRKLGVHVRKQIADELLKVALVAQGPAGPLPVYQEEKVRIYALGGPVAKVIHAARTPDEDQDQILREAAGGGSDAEEILLKIKDLVSA
jgi:hypothetical protein